MSLTTEPWFKRQRHQPSCKSQAETGLSLRQGCAQVCLCLHADTELEAEVEPSLETEQRLAVDEAAREEAARKHEAELARLAQDALAQAAEAERQRAQQQGDLERLRQVSAPCHTIVPPLMDRSPVLSSLGIQRWQACHMCMQQLPTKSGPGLLPCRCLCGATLWELPRPSQSHALTSRPSPLGSCCTPSGLQNQPAQTEGKNYCRKRELRCHRSRQQASQRPRRA